MRKNKFCAWFLFFLFISFNGFLNANQENDTSVSEEIPKLESRVETVSKLQKKYQESSDIVQSDSVSENKEVISEETVSEKEEALNENPEDSKMQGIIYNADNIEYLKGDGLVKGNGNVKITYKGMELCADKVTVNIKEKKAYAEGGAVLKHEGRTYSGESIVYDFELNKGFVSDARVKAYPWYAHGDKVEKDHDKYSVNDGYLTTCELDEPHWLITAKSLVIYLDDKIVAKNVIVYIGKIPVFYWPSYVHSIKDVRGKIMFAPGQNSDFGTYIYTGYRYCLNDENKGALKLDYRKKKGFAYGWDHRYDAADVQGVFRLYYIDEKDKKDQPINRGSRHRVKWTHKQNFTDNLWAVLEWHELSDDTVIKDYIKREYEQDNEPESYLYMQDRFDQFNINLFTKKQTNSFFDTIEYMPELGFHTNHINLWDTPFYFTTDIEYANLNKEFVGLGESANRVDSYQEFNFSKRLGPVTLNPYVGVRQTYYSRDRNRGEEVRGALYSGAKLNLKIHKLMDYYNQFWKIDKLRLIHEPSIEYRYINKPTVDAEKLYQFDSIDGIEKENYVRFKVENRLQTKRFRKESAQGQYKNVNLIKHEAYIDYYPQGIQYFSSRRDLSSIVQNFEVTPFDWMKLYVDTIFDPYERQYDEIKCDLMFKKKDKGSFTFGHHYRREEVSNTTSTLRFNITDKWRAQISNSYDFDEKRMNRQEYILFRDLHCWQTAFSFVQEEDRNQKESEFWITFYLTAFADDAFDFSEGIKGGVG